MPILQVDSTSQTSVCEDNKITYLTRNKLHIPGYVQYKCRGTNKIVVILLSLLLSVHKASLQDFNRHKIKNGITEAMEMCTTESSAVFGSPPFYNNYSRVHRH